MVNISQINPRDYDGKWLSQEEILHWFNLCDAIWLHDRDPKNPHAELSSGLCSNGFFDCQRVLCYPNLGEILARQLAQKLKDNGVSQVDWVVGSAYAAITFSYEVAKILGAVHGFVEKDPTDPTGKKMLWRRITIPANSTVLQAEELIATRETMERVREAIETGNSEPVNFMPVVGALVHRPPKLPFIYTPIKEIEGIKVRMAPIRIVALVEKEIWATEPADCPLCKAGSPRYRPKTHWRELTGKA